MSLYSGQIFGNYEILEILGSGGMGQVYRAKDTRLNREVAIKILSANLIGNAELLSRFKKEAGFAAVLNHPNICTIYETGEVNGQTFISMEYVQGRTLRSRIEGAPIPVPEILDFAIQIADGLEEARKKHIVHRDVKSINMVLTERGIVKILDFGLAKQLPTMDASNGSKAITPSHLTQTGDVRGTPAYMSPEQALGRTIDHRSDIFSFGIVLYEMLAGRLPFVGSSVTEVVDSLLHNDPLPVTRFRDNVPAELVTVLNKMLEKDATLRYQSAHEVWIDLRRIRGDATGRTPPRTVTAVPRRIPSTSTILVIGLVIAAIASGMIYMLRKNKTPEPSQAATNNQKVSIAVLPFRYTGDDPTRQYLGTLVTDGLIAGLQPVRGVAVASFAAVREIKDPTQISDVVHDLGVQWILRGTVDVQGEATKISAEALSSDGTVVWKQTLTGRTVTVMDSALKNILDALHLEDSAKDVAQVRTPSVEAYKKYLEARSRHEGWDVEGNLDDSIALYRETLQKDPDFAAARAGLAMALLKQFEQKHEASLLSSANEEAKRAIALDPNLPEALLAFGMGQAESGNTIEARDSFLRALELAPGDDAACRNLGEMYSTIGRNAEALEMYKRAVELRPSYWRNHYSLGTFEWQFTGDLGSARIHVGKAVELHPQGFAPLVVLGNIYLTQGDLDEAETYFRKALERSANPFAYNNLGLVYYYRGRFDLALRNWQAVLENAPEKSIYQANVADALRQLGRAEEARARYRQVIEGFRQSLKLNPSDDKTRAGLAMALAAIGECSEAVAETHGILRRHSDSPELSAYAAITASRCKDLKWAKEIVLNSIATDNLLMIRFDPDLQPLRELPEVRNSLERAIASASKTSTSEHQ